MPLLHGSLWVWAGLRQETSKSKQSLSKPSTSDGEAPDHKQTRDCSFMKHLNDVLKGMRCTINSKLEIIPDDMMPFNLMEPKSKWLEATYEEISRYAVMSNLSQRCHSSNGQDLTHTIAGRKDMIGILPNVDKYATMALHDGKNPLVNTKTLCLDPINSKSFTWKV